jgi:hypothetical protein
MRLTNQMRAKPVRGSGSESQISLIMLSKGLIPRALFLGEMRIISPVSFELRLLE